MTSTLGEKSASPPALAARAALCSTSPARQAAPGAPLGISFAAGESEFPPPAPHWGRPASGGSFGVFALAARAALCSTPKRCCSSVMTRPRRRKATPWERRAWVPTTKGSSPDARAARTFRFSFAFMEPVRRPTGMPAGASMAARVLQCCSAKISVGAIMAHCQPDRTASQAQPAATAVLPEPTSPWTSRFMGRERAKSAAASSRARRWAPVRVKGSSA